MSVSMSRDELVITPSTERWKRTMKTVPVGLVIFAVVMVVRQGLLGLVLAVITVVLAIAVSYAYMRRAQVIVTATEVGKVGLTGRRLHPRSDVAAVVTARMAERFGDTREFRNLFLLDESGRTIIRLRNSHWSEHDMARVVERLGITPEEPGRVVTGKELGEMYPNAVRWVERRPVLAGLLFGLAILVVAAVIAVIVVASR